MRLQRVSVSFQILDPDDCADARSWLFYAWKGWLDPEYAGLPRTFTRSLRVFGMQVTVSEDCK